MLDVTAARAAPRDDIENTVIVPRGSIQDQTPKSNPPEREHLEAPPLYWFRFGATSDPIPLDVPCYVGRRPSPPRIIAGAVPRLIVVPSALKEVSSTHLELRQLGTSVIVTDLKSTNGSIVMVPGSVPRKLRQGESVVVSPGTLVDIGDDNVIEILSARRVG
jgi:hypothetical protein